MTPTISQYTEHTTASAADEVPISVETVAKKITVANLVAALLALAGDKTVANGTNLVLGTGSGTKIGTAANQKLGFFGATPADQPAVTADLLDSLQELGLIASGAGDTPLNLSGGAVTCGTITLGDAKNIVVNATTGTKIGTANTQKLGFWNAAPAVQPASVADLAVTFTANAPAAANGTLTIANGNNPTVGELLEYCVELEAKLEDLLGKLRTIGIIAT